jgi:hypothetical protein
MAEVQRLRCPACGMPRHQRCFGIGESGFDPDLYPDHDLELMIDTIGGRGRLSVEHRPVTYQQAVAQRDCLRAALERVEAEITAAKAAG